MLAFGIGYWLMLSLVVACIWSQVRVTGKLEQAQLKLQQMQAACTLVAGHSDRLAERLDLQTRSLVRVQIACRANEARQTNLAGMVNEGREADVRHAVALQRHHEALSAQQDALDVITTVFKPQGRVGQKAS